MDTCIHAFTLFDRRHIYRAPRIQVPRRIMFLKRSVEIRLFNASPSGPQFRNLVDTFWKPFRDLADTFPNLPNTFQTYVRYRVPPVGGALK